MNMGAVNLFFATNRSHEGHYLTPSGYKGKFSSDGYSNLRFGEVTVKYEDEQKVQECLNKEFKDGGKGDGEGLSKYLGKNAKIETQAYFDFTAGRDDLSKKDLEENEYASATFFKRLKEEMETCSDTLIFIHGFNVSWEEAVYSATALKMSLEHRRKSGDKALNVILFTWPSDGKMLPWVSYKSDRSDARDSGKAVGRALLKVSKYLSTLRKNAVTDDEKLCEQDIHLLCHSMGNFVLENAIKLKFEGYTRGSRFPRLFKHVFLCAPDVADDALEGDSGLGRLHEMATHVSIYYNKEDKAMHISEYTKHMADRLGHAGNAHPAMVHNKVHQIDCTPIVRGNFVEHGYYLWGSVNNDIWQSINDLDFDDANRKRSLMGQNREWKMG